MHRSGTSLLASILHRLGVVLPGEVIPGDQHNPEGYFEWQAVVEAQERLLIDLERWWPSSKGVQPLPPGWLNHPATLEARQRLSDLLSFEVSRQTGPWVIKDPRSSRLLPLWQSLAASHSIQLRLLLAVRHPAEVTASLLHRDGPLTGMDLDRAQQLWWRHNLEALHGAAELQLPLTVIDFDAWFTAPSQQLMRLVCALDLPSLTPEQHQGALAQIRPEHRRSLAQSADLKIERTLLRLHRRLRQDPLPQQWPAADPPGRLRVKRAASVEAEPLALDPEAWCDWLQLNRFSPAPRYPGLFDLSDDPRLHICGRTWHELTPHLLFQYLPIAGLSGRHLDSSRCEPHLLRFLPKEDLRSKSGVSSLAINLELPPPERAEHWLTHLRAQEMVFDPDPVRVTLMRALGLVAWWLDPAGRDNGWLQQSSACDPARWASRLGLGPPSADRVIVLGHGGPSFDHALAREAWQPSEVFPAIDYLPGWNDLIVSDPFVALLRAGWLSQAGRQAARLVHGSGGALPSEWSLLAGLPHPPIALGVDASPAELLARHRGETLMALAKDRDAPELHIRFQWRQSREAAPCARAAVVVSLYNYGDRIAAALNSVLQQRQVSVELIVIDDASDDDGADVVEQWMNNVIEQNTHPFHRLVFVQHRQNAGLAVARNTAFAMAEASWCFVLDADNQLFPDALRRCLQLAEAGSESLAVVHPLLSVEVDKDRPDDQRSLVGVGSWQREKFLGGNYIDAMALIRHSAWQKVGGYTHIEGGWEDFDFWCKLVEAGLHGVQCPAILATYRSHADSMTAHFTRRLQRPLSRCLQARHPWLALPLADD